jgi:hypothetical protein
MLAISQDVSVYFLIAADLLDTRQRDAKENCLGHCLHAFCRPKLLILAEMGYFPLDGSSRSSSSNAPTAATARRVSSSPQTTATATGTECIAHDARQAARCVARVPPASRETPLRLFDL